MMGSWRRFFYHTLLTVLFLFGSGCIFTVGISSAAGAKPEETAPLKESAMMDRLNASSEQTSREKNPEKTMTLKGRITDTKGRPIEGAIISLSDSPFDSIFSFPDGTFLLQNVPAGSRISLTIFMEGYFPLTRSIHPAELKQSEAEVFILSSLPVGTVAADSPKSPELAKDAVQIEADTLSYERDKDVYHARGQVVMTYTGGVMMAESADLYHKKNEALAEGQVVMVSKDGDVLEGDKVTLAIDKQTGVIEAGRVFIAKTHFYLRGDRIEKRGEATYYIANATATTCDGTSPDWRLTGKELNVTVDGYGAMTNSRMYAKNVPLFYSPYLLFPVKTTRQSGFLLPERMAYSRNRLGMDFSQPFFWAISEDTDATFHQRFMSERGFQEGAEFRYAKSQNSFGTLYGDFLYDQKKITETVGNLSRDWQTEQKRWSLYMNHETRFDSSSYVRADIAKVSDSFYFKDFSSHNYFLANYTRDTTQRYKKISFLGDESLNYLDSTVRVNKAWQNYNLTTLVKSTQDLTAANNDATLQKYPEITLSGMKQSLFGTPVQYELSGIYDYFYRGEGQKGHLLDAFPALSMSLPFRDYLLVTPFAGVRSVTWKRDDVLNDGLTKNSHLENYAAGATMTGEMQRIFQVNGRSVEKIRHAIRPELTYVYASVGQQEVLPNFVSTATHQNTVNSTLSQLINMQTSAATTPAMAGDQHAIMYGVTNTLTARMKELVGGKRYWEVLRFKVLQSYDLKESNRENLPADTNRRPFSDIKMELDIAPFQNLTISARNRYSVNNTTWSQENYDLTVRNNRGDTASVTYRYTQNSIKETNLILKAVMSKSLDLNFRMKRDHFNERDIERLYGFTYKRQCWTFGFDYGDSSTDRVFAFRFALSGL